MMRIWTYFSNLVVGGVLYKYNLTFRRVNWLPLVLYLSNILHIPVLKHRVLQIFVCTEFQMAGLKFSLPAYYWQIIAPLIGQISLSFRNWLQEILLACVRGVWGSSGRSYDLYLT